MKKLKIAWLTDWHGIFVDRDAWELALRITQDFQPDAVPIGSDDIDFYTLSSFDKDPARKERVQDEIDTQLQLYSELLDAVDPMWGTEKARGVHFPTVLGNHNARFVKELWRNPKWYGLRNLEYPRLLEYERFGFSWTGNPWDWEANLDYRVGDIVFTHGTKVSQHPGYSVKNQMNSRFFDASLVMGHCHRGALTYVTKPNGDQLFGVEGFCLCELNPKYAPITNWTQGIVFVTAHDDGAQVELIPFHRNGQLRAYWRGTEYCQPITEKTND